ncbi:MAG: flagellar export protein FliJ [Planctomycetota bacterium]
MRRFTFTLEAALRQREALEEAARKELALALRAQVDCEDRLIAKSAEIDSALVVHPGVSLTASRLIDNRRWVETLRREQGALFHELGHHQQRVLQRQSELATAARDREALTRLRRKRHEEWLRQGLAAEQAVIDEVALGVVRRHQHA